MNSESALITKVLQQKNIGKVLESKVWKNIRFHSDVWNFIQAHYMKYRVLPDIDLVRKKFPDFVPYETDATIEYLIDEVNEEFLRSRLSEILSESVSMIESSPKDALEYIFAMISHLGHQADVVRDVDLVGDYRMRVESLRERASRTGENQVLGVPSGIPQIDMLFGGWQPGDFIVIMGWSSVGKTWLSTYLAVNAWRHGYVPLYFSLEMDDVQFGYRVDTIVGSGQLSATCLVNARNINPDAYEEWARQNYEGRHPFIVVTNEGLEEINQATIQSKIDQYRPSIVFVDYHSLLDDIKRGKTETERHRNLSKDLKRTAVRYGIPIIDIVAVTMEEGHDKRPPELNEVAWSKQLAYDADLVLSLFRNGKTITAEAKKSRRSELFAFRMDWEFDDGNIILDEW